MRTLKTLALILAVLTLGALAGCRPTAMAASGLDNGTVGQSLT